MQNPLYKASDLGEPIPDSKYAVSVCLPLWQDIIDYEENKPRVKQALKAGYPRFVFNTSIKKIIELAEEKFSSKCLPFPSLKVAQRAQNFIGANTEIIEFKNLYFLLFAEAEGEMAFAYWRHTGEIVSARWAEDILNEDIEPKTEISELGKISKNEIKIKIANLLSEKTENIFLFPSGMSSIFTAFRLLAQGKTIQIGFPYVDTLKIQEKFNIQKPYLLAQVNDLETLENIIKSEKIAGIFTEFPTNPLLQSIDLESVSRIAKNYKIPLIIDDTIGNFMNVNLLPFIDILVSSLTKIFTGYGDVMGGSLVLNSKSEYYSKFYNQLKTEYEDLLYFKDAQIISKHCVDFIERATKINYNAEKLCDYLKNHSKVETIFYPKYQNAQNYLAQKTMNGGFGGLFSVLLKNAKKTAPIFYDNLQVNKGPSLGTNYTLACPYTLLAHYSELEFAQNCGVSPYLIRISTGLENIDDLINRLDSAFKAID